MRYSPRPSSRLELQVGQEASQDLEARGRSHRRTASLVRQATEGVSLFRRSVTSVQGECFLETDAVVAISPSL